MNIKCSDLAAKTIDGEVLDVIDAQPPGSTVTYTFSGATDYNFALGIGIKLTNNTTAALLIGDDGNIVWNRKSGGYWRGWKTAITNSDFIKYLETENLNSVVDFGDYAQRKFVNATIDRNYPEESPGLLEVRNYENGFWIYQRYTSSDTGKIYNRRRYNGSWSAWK